MPNHHTEIIIFLIIITAFILIMVIFIIMILFSLQKKQQGYHSDLKAAKFYYDKELYKAQLEIQEQTFQEISREIHDNVGQFLSLAKLSLATLDMNNQEEAEEGIAEISEILEKALEDLRDMSKAMNPDVIRKGGLKRYHESTYLKDMNDRAALRFHATSEQAATIAKKAEVGKLIMGHFSSKYENLDSFLEEAKAIFDNSELAIEGVTFINHFNR